jgi:hypothetical protein
VGHRGGDRAEDVVGGDGRPLMPCGRCRQLLWEHGGATMLIETVSLGIVSMSDVLPDAFGPEDLVAAAGGSGQGRGQRSQGRSRQGVSIAASSASEERSDLGGDPRHGTRSGAPRGSDQVTP